MTEHHDHAGPGHSHDHAGHAHAPGGHVHAPASFGKAFAIGIALNVGFVLIEAVYGVLGNSVALLADAGHNLSDVLGLVVAWVANVLAKRAPTSRYTYGMKGSSILASLFNAVFLLVAVGAIGWEAIQRFGESAPVAGKTVMVVAAIGILVNGITAWLFASGAKGDINIRGAFLHMAADAAVSAGVVLAGLVILYTGWTWLDPVVSLGIVAIIVWSTWGLLRGSLAMSLAAVPPGIDPAAVRRHLEGLPGVTGALAVAEIPGRSALARKFSGHRDACTPSPGCRPALWGRRTISATMKAAITAEARGRLSCMPPALAGMSRKSPTVAPRRRMRMNAAQNKPTRETRVR